MSEHALAASCCSPAPLQGVADGRPASACGIVTLRQQPETARGVVFLSLEDETGTVQVLVWQRRGEMCRLIAGRLEYLTALLGRLATGSRDFR